MIVCYVTLYYIRSIRGPAAADLDRIRLDAKQKDTDSGGKHLSNTTCLTLLVYQRSSV